MTMTTSLRFLEPVDPRKVWGAVTGVVAPGMDYQYDFKRRGSPRWSHDDRELTTNDTWAGTPGQGADAWVQMEFGHEGAMLIPNAWETNDKAVADADREHDTLWVPPAYVEISMDTTYGYKVDGEGCGDLHNRVWVQLTTLFKTPIAWERGECCSGWHVVHESLLRKGPVKWHLEPSL